MSPDSTLTHYQGKEIFSPLSDAFPTICSLFGEFADEGFRKWGMGLSGMNPVKGGFVVGLWFVIGQIWGGNTGHSVYIESGG